MCCVNVSSGVALFPGNAQLLSCKHHYHDYIPALVNPGKPQPGDCEFRNVTYVGPFSNGTQVRRKQACPTSGTGIRRCFTKQKICLKLRSEKQEIIETEGQQ